MIKSETMLSYEEETGRNSTQIISDDIHIYCGFEVWHYEYINWLEAKARKYEETLFESMLSCDR